MLKWVFNCCWFSGQQRSCCRFLEWGAAEKHLGWQRREQLDQGGEGRGSPIMCSLKTSVLAGIWFLGKLKRCCKWQARRFHLIQVLLNFPAVSLLYQLMAVTRTVENMRDCSYQAKLPGYDPRKDMVVKLKWRWKLHFCFVELCISYFLTFYCIFELSVLLWVWKQIILWIQLVWAKWGDNFFNWVLHSPFTEPVFCVCYGVYRDHPSPCQAGKKWL